MHTRVFAAIATILAATTVGPSARAEEHVATPNADAPAAVADSTAEARASDPAEPNATATDGAPTDGTPTDGTPTEPQAVRGEDVAPASGAVAAAAEAPAAEPSPPPAGEAAVVSAPSPQPTALAVDKAVTSQPRTRYVGAQLDIGLPDGGAVGLVVRPFVKWARATVSYTFNGFSSGVRGGVTFDPIKFPIAPTLTFEGGQAFEARIDGSLLGFENDAFVRYSYANAHLGLELGNRDTFRFFIRAGASTIHARVRNVAPQVGEGGTTVTFGEPRLQADLLGTAKLGFAMLF
jgi:hypothetical protein